MGRALLAGLAVFSNQFTCTSASAIKIRSRGGEMNRRILGFSTLVMLAGVAVASAAAAQTPPASSHAAIEKQIVANERAINDAFAKGDLKAFHANIAPDAVGIDPSGINKVNTPDFDKMLGATKILSWNIDGSQFYWIGDASVVHMYRWTGKGTYEGQPVPSPTWASTVWTSKGGKWLAVFHQESTAMPAPTAPSGAKPAPPPTPGKK
jgi:hypothetical protein